MTVWKFYLAITDEQEIAMPIGAEVLHVANQGGDLCLWAQVDPDSSPALRKFYVTGTGRPIPEDGDYLGTAIMPPFVWHVWEERLF